MHHYRFDLEGQSYDVQVLHLGVDHAYVQVNGVEHRVALPAGLALPAAPSGLPSGAAAPARPAAPPAAGPRPALAPRAPASPAPAAPAGAAVPAGPAPAGAIVAPMPGLVLDVLVAVGASVTAGQIVARVEAMKMENNIPAPAAGVVRSVHVQRGAEVQRGQVLLVVG